MVQNAQSTVRTYPASRCSSLPKGKGEELSAGREPFNYGFVDPWGVACDLAKRWIHEGYASVWLRSDGKVFKSRGMIGNGDDFRYEGGPSPYAMDARRVALTNKRESGRAIVEAIRMGQRFPELCEPASLPVRVPDSNAPNSWPRTPDDTSDVEFSDEDAPPEDGGGGGAPSELESLLAASVEAESARRRIQDCQAHREAMANVEIERIPVILDLSCPICGDLESFCDCKDLSLVGRLAA